MQNIKLAPGQSIFDVLLIYSGGISSLFDALKASGLDELDLPEGTIIQVPTVINADVIKALSTELATGSNNIFTGTIEGTTVSVTVKNTALTPIGSGVYSVGTSGEMLIDDTYLEVNGTAIIQFPSASFKSLAIVNGSGVELPILDATSETISVDAGGVASPVGIKLVHPGQSTVFHVGDAAENFYGRHPFFHLAEMNPFGNTHRFTDLNGAQDYSQNIMLDWSTYDGNEVVGWQTNVFLTSNISWAEAFYFISTLEISGFSDWKMPNWKLGSELYFDEQDLPFDYPPLNDTLGITFWTSSTVKTYGLTDYARVIRRDGPAWTDKAGSGGRAFPYRIFTNTEIGL